MYVQPGTQEAGFSSIFLLSGRTLQLAPLYSYSTALARSIYTVTVNFITQGGALGA